MTEPALSEDDGSRFDYQIILIAVALVTMLFCKVHL